MELLMEGKKSLFLTEVQMVVMGEMEEVFTFYLIKEKVVFQSL